MSFVQNTGGTLIAEFFQFSGGPLVDLDANPSITIQNLTTSAIVVGPTTVGVVHAATGVYTYNWNGIAPVASYLVIWNGLSAAVAVQASEITSLVPAATSGGNVTPCGWEGDTGCCPDFATLYTAEVQAAAKEYGALVMWAATGRRFGLCTKTVRPCGRENPFMSNVYGYFWSDGTWFPYIFNGAWRNCWSGCATGPWGCCTCEPQCQVWLPEPVDSIVSVTVDGVLIDPSTYRVDNRQWLVRTHDASTSDCWPLCQDFNLNSGTGVFEVTYLWGLPVPSILLRAAGELACEWAKNCVGAACRLPQRVTSIARQGVNVSFVDIDALLKNGLTGLTTVDQIIVRFNPYGLTSAMKIASPDLLPVRETTWP